MSTNYYWLVPEDETRRLEEIRQSALITKAFTIIRLGDIWKMPARDHPAIHIGQYSNGTFVWAQEPTKVREICNMQPDEIIAESEHGVKFTGRELLEEIKAERYRTNMIGKEFF